VQETTTNNKKKQQHNIELVSNGREAGKLTSNDKRITPHELTTEENQKRKTLIPSALILFCQKLQMLTSSHKGFSHPLCLRKTA